jgi:uncharacterized membrane protein
MEYLLGILTGVGLFAFIILSIYIGYRMGNKRSHTNAEPSEDEQRQQKELKEQFTKLMNYDLNTALQRKKVE